MHRLMLIPFLVLLAAAACTANPLEAGRAAIEQRAYGQAIEKLRPAARATGAGEEVVKLYAEALQAHRAELRDTRTKTATCDESFRALTAIEGFGSDEAEATVLSQALLCSARERARSKQVDEAATIVVEGMDRHPGFGGGSPVLAKALEAPAQAAARAGKVREATALAQVLFGSGEPGLALSTLDLLETSGASPEAITDALRQRHDRAKISDAAAGLAAGYAAYRDHPDEAARWYDEIVARAAAGKSASEVEARRYAKARAEEATALADSTQPACKLVKERIPLASGLVALQAAAITPTEGGAIVAWIEGAEVPAQKLLAVRVGWNGERGSPITVAEQVVPAEPPDPEDPQGAFAPKNRETSLALVPCAGAIEVAARGAPQGGWMRATLGPDGSVVTPPARVPRLGETARMPNEDVWWNVGCANDMLVHVWLADTQLMRLAWFAAGAPQGEPANVRLAGFAPAFEVRGGEGGATLLTWVDIMGEGLSQVIWASIPEDRSVAVSEEQGTVVAAPVAESIDGRVEQMRLERVGDRFALVWVPRGGDFGLRWIDSGGRPLGHVTGIIPMRPDAADVRFDAAGAGPNLGVAWTDRLTESWSALFFRATSPEGAPASKVQRIAGLVRPDLSPLLVGSPDGVFVLVWVDRSALEGEALVASVLRCGG